MFCKVICFGLIHNTNSQYEFLLYFIRTLFRNVLFGFQMFATLLHFPHPGSFQFNSIRTGEHPVGKGSPMDFFHPLLDHIIMGQDASSLSYKHPTHPVLGLWHCVGVAFRASESMCIFSA